MGCFSRCTGATSNRRRRQLATGLTSGNVGLKPNTVCLSGCCAAQFLRPGHRVGVAGGAGRAPVFLSDVPEGRANDRGPRRRRVGEVPPGGRCRGATDGASPVVKLLARTGIRVGEICELRAMPWSTAAASGGLRVLARKASRRPLRARLHPRLVELVPAWQKDPRRRRDGPACSPTPGDRSTVTW